jgi:hypothetical protein
MTRKEAHTVILKHGSILPLVYAPVTTIQEVALRTADVNPARTHLANTIIRKFYQEQVNDQDTIGRCLF